MYHHKALRAATVAATLVLGVFGFASQASAATFNLEGWATQGGGTSGGGGAAGSKCGNARALR
ncbi:MAG TPA: hypothetical protein VFC19_17085 [Candidatus Limnocylindrales bacterium]|nr:hypothetical protein [Candidatus Limnocylindrales bacterium]